MFLFSLILIVEQVWFSGLCFDHFWICKNIDLCFCLILFDFIFFIYWVEQVYSVDICLFCLVFVFNLCFFLFDCREMVNNKWKFESYQFWTGYCEIPTFSFVFQRFLSNQTGMKYRVHLWYLSGCRCRWSIGYWIKI